VPPLFMIIDCLDKRCVELGSQWDRDRLMYKYDAGSLAANLLEIKILINSTISDIHKGAYFMSVNIKDHFLAILMRDLEYMKVKYQHILLDIQEHYNLDIKVTSNSCVYVKIKKKNARTQESYASCIWVP